MMRDAVRGILIDSIPKAGAILCLQITLATGYLMYAPGIAMLPWSLLGGRNIDPWQTPLTYVRMQANQLPVLLEHSVILGLSWAALAVPLLHRKRFIDVAWRVALAVLVAGCFAAPLAAIAPGYAVEFMLFYGIPTAVVAGISIWFWHTLPNVKLPAKVRDPRFCSVCTYDLAGNESGVCPECGTKVS